MVNCRIIREFDVYKCEHLHGNFLYIHVHVKLSAEKKMNMNC
jgi:hypothetical protein